MAINKGVFDAQLSQKSWFDTAQEGPRGWWDMYATYEHDLVPTPNTSVFPYPRWDQPNRPTILIRI